MPRKTRVALVVDSRVKATKNTYKTMVDVRTLNMSCSTLQDMIEIAGKVFGAQGTPTETTPLPPLFIFSNVIDHPALLDTSKHFKEERAPKTQELLTDFVHEMRKVIRIMCLTDTHNLLEADQVAASAKKVLEKKLLFSESLCLTIKTHRMRESA